MLQAPGQVRIERLRHFTFDIDELGRRIHIQAHREFTPAETAAAAEGEIPFCDDVDWMSYAWATTDRIAIYYKERGWQVHVMPIGQSPPPQCPQERR